MHDDIQTTLAGEAGAVLVVRLPEDLNHLSADKVRACVASRLPEHDEAGVVLDASSLTLISSIGVAALLQVQEIAHERGCAMCIVRLRDEALAFLAMLRLEDKFTRFDSEDEGVRHCESRR